jgi:ribosomal-protein-alanine N-acetyltransferase
MKEAKPFPELATKRLRLRRFRMDDLVGLHACFGDPDAMRYWNMLPSKTSADTARWVKALGQAKSPHTWLGWAVAEKRGDRCIGMVNYHHREPRHRRLEIGYILAPAQQGKGLMTEAVHALLGYCFAELSVHRVEALIDPANAASIRLVGRLGFRPEGGPLRDYWRVADTYRSTMMYSLLAGELAQPPALQRSPRTKKSR